MRVRLLPVPCVLAIVVACAGSDHFTGPGTGAGIGGQLGDAGPVTDGGPDAGPSDAGPSDGGCNTQILPLGTVFANDNCAGVGQTTTTASIVSAGCGNVNIQVNDGISCNGSLAGAANAFTGTCNTNPCTSTRLPGTITCTLANSTTCTTQICADSAGANCPQ
jgi:hypothetical protein